MSYRRRATALVTATMTVGALLVFDVVSLPTPVVVPQVRTVSLAAELEPVSPSASLQPVPLAGDVTAGYQTDVILTEDFSLMGVTWEEGERGPADVLVEARLREADGWTGWTTLEPNDAGPDAGTEEAALSAGTNGTEPLVTDGADALQIRITTAGDALPEELSAVTIDPGESPEGLSETAQPLASADAFTPRPTIITRASWGADESRRRCNASYSSTLVAGAVHHTAGTNNYTKSQSAGIVRGIYAYHTGSMGWCDIGYNFLVDKYGQVFEGRHGGVTQAVRGAHSGGFNDRTLGVAALGNYETATAPATMVSRIGHVIGWKLGLFGSTATGNVSLTSAGGGTARHSSGTEVSIPAVFAHRDVGYTACPGRNLVSEMATIRQTAAGFAGGATVNQTIVPLEADLTGGTEMLAYDPATGSAVLYDQSTAGVFRPLARSAWPVSYSSVVAVELDGTAGDEILAYDQVSGRAVVYDVAPSGTTRPVADMSWSPGWGTVAAVEVDKRPGSEVLVYNPATGRQLVVQVQGTSTRILRQAAWSRGWEYLQVVDVDGRIGSELSVYNPASGRHLFVDLANGTGSGTISEQRFSRGWDVISILEVDGTAGSEMLTYNSRTGRVVFTDIGVTGTRTMSMTAWSPAWSRIVAAEVDLTKGSEILTYNSRSGRIVTTDISSSGGTRTIG